jgi:uncharacterized protein YfiM (DUF2279 family)
MLPFVLRLVRLCWPAASVLPVRCPRLRSWIFALTLACVAACSANAQARDDFFGADKVAHFTFSAYFAISAYSLACMFDAPAPARLGFGLGVPLALGLAKEGYDFVRGGDASLRDLAWDAIGTIVGLSLAWLVGEVLFPSPPRVSAAAGAGQPSVAPPQAYFFLTK